MRFEGAGLLLGACLMALNNAHSEAISLMKREYDIRPQDEAYEAMRREYQVYDWTTSGIFTCSYLIVAVLLLVLPS